MAKLQGPFSTRGFLNQLSGSCISDLLSESLFITRGFYSLVGADAFLSQFMMKIESITTLIV